MYVLLCVCKASDDHCKNREGERVDSERCERPLFIRAKTQEEGEIKKGGEIHASHHFLPSSLSAHVRWLCECGNEFMGKRVRLRD
jgi:hypothetical protein